MGQNKKLNLEWQFRGRTLSAQDKKELLSQNPYDTFSTNISLIQITASQQLSLKKIRQGRTAVDERGISVLVL
jgi:hypothetical protein